MMDNNNRRCPAAVTAGVVLSKMILARRWIVILLGHGMGALGRSAKKVWRSLFVRDKQPSMPTTANLAAPVADLPHLVWVAAPMPPEFCVRADLDGVHAVGDR
jgi:hypothetical protein